MLTTAAVIVLAASAAWPEPIVFNDDAGWCWFQDERAIVWNGALWAGSVAAGVDDPSRRGDIELTRYDLQTGTVTRIELHDRLELDDHDAPALLPLDSDTLLAVFARHGNDRLVRTRRVHADGSLVGDEQVFEPSPDSSHGVTYANVFRLTAENQGTGRIYNFFRGKGWDPNVIISDDGCQTWKPLGQLLAGPGRPYVRYASNNRDTIHFFCTDQHPRDFDNSLYYGFVRDGRIWASDDEPLGTLGNQVPAHEQLTRVFAGSPDAVAWPCDVELDQRGYPCVVYSVQVDGAGLPAGQGGMDHRFRFARFDGSAWHDQQIAFAGTRLYPGEDDYTGLAAIDPADTSVVYISTDADPGTGAPLFSNADGKRHRELFRGRRSHADGQDLWTWEPITTNSKADNIRPHVTKPADGVSALLWLRGTLSTYTDYDLDLVGYILSRTDDARLTFGADRVAVDLGARPFTQFVFGNIRRPYLHPVLGPNQTPMTRDYPVAPSTRAESHDHPHHTSMWFAHGDVNGEDFWTMRGSFRLIGAVVPTPHGLKAEYDLLRASGETIGTFELDLSFDAERSDQWRAIDSLCTFRAPQNAQLRLGDTKEGTFAVRTHPSLRLDPGAGVTGQTGQASNSEGISGKAVWGRRAAWVDYWGQIDGNTVGLAVFDHPDNPRHPTWWHARGYGLIAANPFGTAAFEGTTAGRGDLHLTPGTKVTFAHRFLFHAGSTNTANIPRLYSDWSGSLVHIGFEQQVQALRFDWTDPDVFRIASETHGRVLELIGPANYTPPHRSPRSIAVLRSPAFQDFELTCRVRQTGREYPHRDLCLIFGYQDPAHFYYAHLASAADDNAHHIMIVNGADRTPITSSRTPGLAWGKPTQWHTLRLVRQGPDVRVYFDGQTQPVLEAEDTTFRTGRIGFGSFDDSAVFDDIIIRALDAHQ